MYINIVLIACFTDNTITGNQWGGIDIRRGGDPVIYHNTVCNGISDGIVIGEEGRGSVENNIITGEILFVSLLEQDTFSFIIKSDIFLSGCELLI